MKIAQPLKRYGVLAPQRRSLGTEFLINDDAEHLHVQHYPAGAQDTILAGASMSCNATTSNLLDAPEKSQRGQ